MARINGNILFSGTVGGVTVTKKGVVRENVPRRKRSLTRKAMRSKCIVKGVMSVYPTIKDQLMGTLEGCANLGEASNQFLKLNYHRTHVWIPKDLEKSGASFVADYAVSHGTLYRIEQQLSAGNLLRTDIMLADDITADTSIGQLSADILSHNCHFSKGDVLKLFYLEQRLVCNQQIPQAVCHVDSLRLSLNDTTLLTQVTEQHAWCRSEGFLALAEPLDYAAATFIHVRITAGGRLLASPQELICVNPTAEAYTTEEAFEAAYRSYGGNEKA